jgi:NMD protein affecting ribosome stability and mRNA decay
VEVRGLKDPTMCEICGAVYTRKTWRAGPRTAKTPLVGVGWTVCPACRQGREGEYYGRVLIPGPMSETTAGLVTRRIRNVASRARFTQPERRVVSMAAWQGGLEVLTTSQKLAHRIARELEKAFGGTTRYRWASRDGELMATWVSLEAAAGAATRPMRRSAP